VSSTKGKAKKGVVKSRTAGKASTSPKRRAAARKKKTGHETGDVTEERCEGILCPAAMDNLYYIAHDAADALRLRGFHWHKLKAGKKRKRAKT